MCRSYDTVYITTQNAHNLHVKAVLADFGVLALVDFGVSTVSVLVAKSAMNATVDPTSIGSL